MSGLIFWGAACVVPPARGCVAGGLRVVEQQVRTANSSALLESPDTAVSLVAENNGGEK